MVECSEHEKTNEYCEDCIDELVNEAVKQALEGKSMVPSMPRPLGRGR